MARLTLHQERLKNKAKRKRRKFLKGSQEPKRLQTIYLRRNIEMSQEIKEYKTRCNN